MKRAAVLLAFTVLALSTTSLFQNCGGDYKGTADADSDATLTELNNRVAPDFLSNRSIPLDNKNTVGDSSWSVGGEDKFYYETTYRAKFESTLVTVFGRISQAYLSVESDDCAGERPLSSNEAIELSGFFEDYIPNTIEKVADPQNPRVEGCGFPRLILDSAQRVNGVPGVDFEIFFASEECTPDNDLYVANIGGAAGVDPIEAKVDVETWFNGQIDLICEPQS